MSEEFRKQLWYVREEPQFIPPILGLVVLASVDFVPISSTLTPSTETQSMLVAVCVISSAALLVERGIDEAFRRMESRTFYQKSTSIEKIVKSGLLLIFAAILFNRPAVEQTVSTSILFAGISVVFYYWGLRLQDTNIVVHAALAVITAMFALGSVVALWTTYIVIS